MKKVILFLLTAILFVGILSGCSTTENKSTEQSSDTFNSKTATESVTSDDNSVSDIELEFDCRNSLNVEREQNGKFVEFYIRTPYFSLGKEGGTGLYGDLGNGTKVFIASVNPYIYDDDSFDENKFPADFGEMKELVENFRSGSSADDMEFTIEKAEKVSHAGYDMIRYTGTHTYRYFGAEDFETSPEMKYFAYAMRLKGNNAVVSWLVLDDVTNAAHTDTSLAEAEEIADGMAETVSEETNGN